MQFGPRIVALLCVLYALVGITNHDPWKNADAINLAIAFDFYTRIAEPQTSGLSLAVPTLAGEPALFNPPLYHYVAASLGAIFGDWIGWHNGARLASALFTLIGLFLVSLAARGFHGRDAALIAPLLCIGSLGLLVPTHDAQPALVGFAAFAGVLAALAWWELSPRAAAAGLGLAVGLGFLGSGLLSVLLALSAITVALCFRNWRKVSQKSWLISAGVAGCLVLAWPLMLYQHAPQYALRWLELDWHRIAASTIFDPRRIQLLLWGTWPVLPLAAWALWLHRHQALIGRHVIPLATGVIALLVFCFANDGNETMPIVIAALAVIGSAEAGRLRRGAANAFDWFGAITLTLFMSLIWLAGIAILTGQPARIAKNFTKPALGFQPEFSWPALLIASGITALWIYLLFRLPRSPWRANSRWALGIVSICILISCFLSPWVDYTKSYRNTMLAIVQEIGPEAGCIQRSGLGLAHRASLYYFTGLRTTPSSEDASCRFRLIQTGVGKAPNIPGWTLRKDFFRPGERRERLRLYERNRQGG